MIAKFSQFKEPLENVYEERAAKSRNKTHRHVSRNTHDSKSRKSSRSTARSHRSSTQRMKQSWDHSGSNHDRKNRKSNLLS